LRRTLAKAFEEGGEFVISCRLDAGADLARLDVVDATIIDSGPGARSRPEFDP
jgi:hypothetical protein